MTHDEIAYTWNGTWDEGAGGPVEFFGGHDGLPIRDLTVADIAALNDDQKAKLASETGRRLYRPVRKHGTGKPASTEADTE